MPRSVRLLKLVILTLGLLALSASNTSAQMIQWRLDYNKARQEAKEKNLPLLMDVGTTGCFWCNKLDATTFRDPAVVKLINEYFIPIRVDGNKYKSLIDALHIEHFPTLAFATPQGTVVSMREGYQDGPKFYVWTQQVLASLYPQPGGSGLQLTSAQKPAPPAVDRAAQARAWLAMAEEEFRGQQYVCCLLRCKMLAASFPELPEAQTARQLAAKLKSDPERVRLTSEQLTQSLCELYLDLAGSLLQKGQRDLALPYLQWIAQACPNTPQSQAAQQMLQQPAPAAASGFPSPGKFAP